MNFLAFTYMPMPIIMGGGGNVSNLPPYASGILIAATVVGFVFLICICLSIVFEGVFDREDVSEVFMKASFILLTLCVVLIGIALLCALIGV